MELFSSGARASLPAGLNEWENSCGLEVRAPLRFWKVSPTLLSVPYNKSL